MTVAAALAPPRIEFRAEDHTYWLDGKLVPNVTRVLSLVSDWSRVDPAALAKAQQEGVDMHKMVELHIRDDLDEATLPEWLKPRLAGLKKFIADTGFVMIASEQRVFHPFAHYAGTLDLIGRIRLPGFRVPREVVACIDVKRTLYAGNRLVGLQVAGYMEAWNSGGCVPKVTHRYALQLRDNDYRLAALESRSDYANFTACLLVHRLKGELQ